MLFRSLSSFGPQGNLAIRNDNGAAGTVPLSITAHATQSVNLFQILASDNSTVRFGVSSAGALTVSPSAGVALTVKPVAGANSQVWFDSSNNQPTRMNEFAQLGIRNYGNTYNNASLSVATGYDAGGGIAIRGNSATQSGDLFQLQTGASGNAVLAKFD